MTNIFQSPNLLRINGDVTLAYSFGEVLRVNPIPHPHGDDRVVACFRGLHLELTRQDALRLAVDLTKAAHCVRETPDYSGIAYGDQT